MSLQYIQTLEGPKPRRVQLLGFFDTFQAHPFMLVLGLGAGIFLGLRKKGRK